MWQYTSISTIVASLLLWWPITFWLYVRHPMEIHACSSNLEINLLLSGWIDVVTNCLLNMYIKYKWWSNSQIWQVQCVTWPIYHMEFKYITCHRRKKKWLKQVSNREINRSAKKHEKEWKRVSQTNFKGPNATLDK